METQENNQHYSLEYFLSVGVLTGSRAFKVEKEDSDWDIIIHYNDFRVSLYKGNGKALIPKISETNILDYEICIDFINSPGVQEADGVEDTEYLSSKDELIWGDKLTRIIKVWCNEEDENECINLFIYQDSATDIKQKFKEINALMRFTLTKEQLENRETRVARFRELLIAKDIAVNCKK